MNHPSSSPPRGGGFDIFFANGNIWGLRDDVITP